VLTKETLPQWLQDWRANTPFSSRDFFGSRVVFYPGSGRDGQPVEFFGTRHAAHCFVFVDYGLSQRELSNMLSPRGQPFRGYASAGRIPLTQRDLSPRGWNPILEPHEVGRSMPLANEAPYGFVEILDRKQGFDDSHGPQRLAILFLFADGAAAYAALFCQPDQSTPFAVVLQDHGFSGNWADFGRDGALETIAHRARRLPDYLLVGEQTRPWSGYEAVPGETLGRGGMYGFTRQLYLRKG
jgi:hypothetical protein